MKLPLPFTVLVTLTLMIMLEIPRKKRAFKGAKKPSTDSLARQWVLHRTEFSLHSLKKHLLSLRAKGENDLLSIKLVNR